MEYSREFLQLLNNKSIYWVNFNMDFVGSNSFDTNIYKRLENVVIFKDLYSNRYRQGLFSIVNSMMASTSSREKSDNWYCFYRDYSASVQNSFLVKINGNFCFMNSNDIGELKSGNKNCFFSLWEIIEHLDIDIEKSYKHGTDSYSLLEIYR